MNPTPAGIRRSTVYLPELECLRGLAIFLVMYFHADGTVRMPFGNSIGTWPPLATALLFAGHTGVSLFFILSAFLLSTPFLAEADGGRRVSRVDFYRRRALRILPLYWCVMIVGGLVTAPGPGRVVAYMLFLNSFPSAVGAYVPFTNVTWSLAAEFQFYLVLPLLTLCIGSPARRRIGGVLLGLYAVFYGCLVTGRLDRIGTPALYFIRSGVLGRAPLFLFGILGAMVYRRHANRLRELAARWPWAGDALLIACFVALALLLRPIVFLGAFRSDARWFAWHVLEGALWTLIVLLVLIAPLRLRPLLVNPIFARLGLLSYSIYLLHQPVWHYSLYAVRRAWSLSSGWVPGTGYWIVGASMLLIGLCEFTYRYVEQPFLVRKSRID